MCYFKETLKGHVANNMKCNPKTTNLVLLENISLIYHICNINNQNEHIYYNTTAFHMSNIKFQNCYKYVSICLKQEVTKALGPK